MDRDRVQRDAAFQEFALHFLLSTDEVRAVAQVRKRRRSEEYGALVRHVGTAQMQAGLSI